METTPHIYNLGIGGERLLSCLLSHPGKRLDTKKLNGPQSWTGCDALVGN